MNTKNTFYMVIVLIGLLFVFNYGGGKNPFLNVKATQKVFMDFQDEVDFKISRPSIKITHQNMRRKIQQLKTRKVSLRTKKQQLSKKKATKVVKKKDKKKKKKTEAQKTLANKKTVKDKKSRAKLEDSNVPNIISSAPKDDVKEASEETNEWIERFKQFPNVNTLKQFLSDHQLANISDQVFYAVVESLLEGTNIILKKLALTALDASQTVRSFHLLVEKESSPEFLELKVMIEQALNRYTFEGRLFVLKQVIGSSQSIASVVRAGGLLSELVKKLTQGQNEKGEIQTLALTEKRRNQMLGLQELLNRAIGDSTNNDVNEQLTSTLSVIEGVLKDTTKVAENLDDDTFAEEGEPGLEEVGLSSISTF